MEHAGQSPRKRTGFPLATATLLLKQLKEVQESHDFPGISCGLVDDEDVSRWEIMLMVPDDCKFYGGGTYRARLSFRPEYPVAPPSLTFLEPIPWHPNVYPNGDLCISILNEPDDDMPGEQTEQWSPIQSPRTILISVVNLLYEPNEDSPANVDAGVQLRAVRAKPASDAAAEFRKRCRAIVRKTLGED